MDDLVSIIVPVYKTEKYIHQCVDSLLLQTFTDFEVLLVDDCSPDCCGAICEEYALKDSRVKVIHHLKNMGLSAVRNTGMKFASGKWLMFVDSDDWLETDALQKLSEKMQDGTDLIVFGMVQEFEDERGRVKRRKYIVPGEWNAKVPTEIGYALVRLEKDHCFQYTCNKVYRFRLLLQSKAEFKDVDLMEDFEFNSFLWKYFTSISIIAYAPYHYRRFKNGGSLAMKYSADFFGLSKMRYQKELELLKELNANKNENICEIQYVFFKHLVSVLARNQAANASLSWKENYKITKKMVNDGDVINFFHTYKANGLVNKIICRIFRLKAVSLLLLLGKLSERILRKG